jgi:hypothetical protein
MVAVICCQEDSCRMLDPVHHTTVFGYDLAGRPTSEAVALPTECPSMYRRAMAAVSPDQVLLALDPGRVVWDRPRSGEVEEPLATALDVDGDGELARLRLLGEEEPELQGIVVGEAGEDEIPLLCLHPLPLLIGIVAIRLVCLLSTIAASSPAWDLAQGVAYGVT